MIRLEGVGKSYGDTHALRDLTLELRPGEVHAICGENGAGKSTLNRILCGLVKPDTGSISAFGEPLALASLRASERAGIAMVHQESAVFPHLTTTENHEVMRETSPWWLDRRWMSLRTKLHMAIVGETFDFERPLAERSLAQRQMVSISRALSSDCRLLILDEPTASLSNPESEALFLALKAMREKGLAIVYVSHRLSEIFELADRVSVLRDGRLISTQAIAETSPEDLVRQMVGREITAGVAQGGATGAVALRVQNLTQKGIFDDVSFEVREGEVLGLAGLVGAGRSNIARALVGLDSVDSGHFEVTGKIALVPEDRQHEGLHLSLTTAENVAMSGKRPLLDFRREREEAGLMIEALAIKAAPNTVVASLSGGNQQKVLLAKWLVDPPKVLILDEPTRGVDVGAKAQIHDLVRDLALKGTAILLVSSELPEILALSNRIVVLREGRIAGELSASEATQESLIALALPTGTADPRQMTAKRGLSQEMLVAALVGLMFVTATAMNPAFASPANLMDLLVKVAPAIIVGVMMTLLILAREIDISIGAQMGLCAAVLGIVSSPDRMGLPPAVGVLACLGAGLAVGVVNGVLVSFAKVPSIIVTLGMLTILRGVTEKLMGGEWIENMPPALRQLGVGSLYGLPWVVLIALAFVLVGLWLTRKTAFGLRTYALGSDPHIAHLRGIPETKIRLVLFALVGLASAVAALFSAPQLQVIESGFGNGFELVVIAAVVVGGTSIRGGKGTIWGSALGAVLLGAISTVLIFMRLGDGAVYWERAIQGGLILLAVVGDRLWGRRT